MAQKFGGGWTEAKLKVIRRYFSACAVALKGQSSAKWYVDAFAGTGQRSEAKLLTGNQDGLYGSDESVFAGAKDGSVRIALKIDPPFQRYVLIERSKAGVAELHKLREELPFCKIDNCQGDTNLDIVTILEGWNHRCSRSKPPNLVRRKSE